MPRKKSRKGYKQGQWQRESPAKEHLEQVKSSAGTDCTPKMMKYGYFALKGRDWEKYKSIFKVEKKATEWAFERIREAFEKVAKDEAGRLNIVQGIMLKSTDFLRRIIAPVGGQGGVICAHIATVFPWRTTCGGFLQIRSTAEDYIRWVATSTGHSNN